MSLAYSNDKTLWANGTEDLYWRLKHPAHFLYRKYPPHTHTHRESERERERLQHYTKLQAPRKAFTFNTHTQMHRQRERETVRDFITWWSKAWVFKDEPLLHTINCENSFHLVGCCVYNQYLTLMVFYIVNLVWHKLLSTRQPCTLVLYSKLSTPNNEYVDYKIIHVQDSWCDLGTDRLD